MKTSLTTEGQFLIAIELIRRATDLRMTHRHRSSMIKYARDVLRANGVNTVEVEELSEMLESLEQYSDKRRAIHTDMKRICKAILERMEAYHADMWGNKRAKRIANQSPIDDIPF